MNKFLDMHIIVYVRRVAVKSHESQHKLNYQFSERYFIYYSESTNKTFWNQSYYYLRRIEYYCWFFQLFRDVMKHVSWACCDCAFELFHTNICVQKHTLKRVHIEKMHSDQFSTRFCISLTFSYGVYFLFIPIFCFQRIWNNGKAYWRLQYSLLSYESHVELLNERNKSTPTAVFEDFDGRNVNSKNHFWFIENPR